MGVALSHYKHLNLPWATQKDVETTAQVIGSIPPSVTAKVAKIGPYGAGKSTNIDSIASALTGRVEKPAGAGHGASTLTINSTIHNLRYLLNPDARPTYQLVNVSVLDTPGSYFEDLVTARRRVDECEPAKRHRWTKEYERQVATLVQWLVNNKVGCVDVTLSLSGLKTYWNSWTSEFEPQSLALYQMKVTKDLFEAATKKRMRVFCTLTKADEVDRMLKHSPAYILESTNIERLWKTVATATGIPVDQVFPCMNLTKQAPRSNPVLCRLLLHIAYTIMHNTCHASEGQLLDGPRNNQPAPPAPPVDLEPAADAYTVASSSVAGD